MSQRAIEALLRDKSSLLAERQKIDNEITGIDVAIERVSGKTIWEIERQMQYDDNNPDYIKGTEDGI